MFSHIEHGGKKLHCQGFNCKKFETNGKQPVCVVSVRASPSALTHVSDLQSQLNGYIFSTEIGATN